MVCVSYKISLICVLWTHIVISFNLSEPHFTHRIRETYIAYVQGPKVELQFVDLIYLKTE